MPKKNHRRKRTTSPATQPKRKIFVIYLNDVDRDRDADLINLSSRVAKKKGLSRSEYISGLIVKDLVKHGAL